MLAEIAEKNKKLKSIEADKIYIEQFKSGLREKVGKDENPALTRVVQELKRDISEYRQYCNTLKQENKSLKKKLQQYEKIKDLADVVSYSSKTNPIVPPIT